MKSSPRMQDQRRFICVLVGLFAACCILMFHMQALVAADRIGDMATVLIELGLALAFVAMAFVAIYAASKATLRVERIVLWAVPAAVLFAGAVFAKTGYADVSVALNALTQVDDGARTILALGPGGHDVRLSGDLTEGAAARLAILLDAHPAVERIHLTSDGGLADEGEALRKVIAAHGLTTFVPDYCVSACTLAFLGGRERLVTTDARLGFHAPFEEGLFGQTFVGDARQERESYLAAGVASDFVDAAMKIAPQDLWTPNIARLLQARVATSTVDRYKLPASNLDGADNLAGARTSVLQNFPLTTAIDRNRPEAVNAIAAWYLDAYRNGRSEGEIADRLKEIVGAATTLLMSDADDETLVGLARFLLAAMDAADSEDACVAIGRDASLIEAEATLDEDDKGADDLAVALLSRAFESRLSSRHGSLNRPRAGREDGIAFAAAQQPCAEIRDIYAKALRLPRRDGATLIRALVSRPASSLRMPASLTALYH